MQEALNRKEAEQILFETLGVKKPNMLLIKFFFEVTNPAFNRFSPKFNQEEMRRIGIESSISEYSLKYFNTKSSDFIDENLKKNRLKKIKNSAYEKLALVTSS